MPSLKLYPYQLDAVNKLENGYILCGGVGSGKSITSLAYYYKENGGDLYSESYSKMKEKPQDLIVITTARKRDTFEWVSDMAPFLITPFEESKVYDHKVIIDSWNNIQKYKDYKDAFFIFDEQRLVGSGAWVKAFYKIAKNNNWILLSATPGDTWADYIPVFVANGFYKNKTEFINDHVVYSRFSKYPKIERYLNTGRLIRLRNKILVDMDFERPTVAHHEDVYCSFNNILYKELIKNRWNLYKEKPIENASELCYEMRRIVNSDPSRIEMVDNILELKKKAIIFYNFDYELEILKEHFNSKEDVKVAEWNGHAHQPIPDSDKWVYLVQYTAGAEGWNCIKTDTIIFYSQNYSYKIMVQSAGRIDRLNTPYIDLYYYHLKSRSGIDVAISKAIKSKKKFNERKFLDSN